MDSADLAIEIAGMLLIAVMMAGVFAAVGERKRLVMGIAIGMLLALIALPFVSYLVARITNHHATDIDLTPPAYIVVTAITCAALAIGGAIGGLIAEARRGSRPAMPPEQHRRVDDGPDQVADWLPWGSRDWPR